MDSAGLYCRQACTHARQSGSNMCGAHVWGKGSQHMGTA